MREVRVTYNQCWASVAGSRAGSGGGWWCTARRAAGGGCGSAAATRGGGSATPRAPATSARSSSASCTTLGCCPHTYGVLRCGNLRQVTSRQRSEQHALRLQKLFRMNEPSTSAEETDNNPQYVPIETTVVDRLVRDLLDLEIYFTDDLLGSGSFAELNFLAEKQEGWIQVVTSIINVIPIEDVISPSVISLLIDDFALPCKESVLKIVYLYGLSRQRAHGLVLELNVDRNMCVLLGCVAEKLVGANSQAIFTENVQEYLLTLLSNCRVPCIVLYALIALEKFAYITENKKKINNWLKQNAANPLILLEAHAHSSDYFWRQVGFCAQWALDNVFTVENRKLSYEVIDMSEIFTILNCRDMTECLKVSPDGLEARCDSYSFESIRGTFHVDHGSWYYEATIITPGIMQIGWATENSVFMSHEVYGVGDDIFSISYDGCRRIIWHSGIPQRIDVVPQWRPGDVLGCLIDIDDEKVMFYLNGVALPVSTEIFEVCSSGFFAAASFMTFQQCRFNFGNEPFRFPPSGQHFYTLNDFGELTDDQKKVIPKRLLMAELTSTVECEDRCVVCYDNPAACVLEPCGHRGFCAHCTTMVHECPLCRAEIVGVHDEEI